jgi:hypothetical protein
MPERLIWKNLEFSTADAENVELFFFNGTLLWLKFSDWQGQVFQVEFSEIVGFSWSEEELEHKKMKDDCVYQVVNSNLLEKHKAVGTISKLSNHKHYKICFNDYGILDVVFGEMKIVKNEVK